MSRRAKGRVAPPPVLSPAAQRVADAVGALPGVIVQAHWEIGSQRDINGTDFYVGEVELGHIHLEGEAHVPIGEELARVLVKAKQAKRFHWNPAFVVADTEDHDRAMWLFELRHAQIAGATDEELRARIASR